MHTKNEALNYAIENSIIDYEAILHEMDMAERKELLAMHPYKIWKGSDGGYYTYFPDDFKGRIRRKRSTRKALEDDIVAFWQDQTTKITVEDVFNEWNDRRLELGQIAPSTYDRNKQIFTNHFEFFKQRDIKDLTPEDVEDFLEERIAKCDLTAKAFSNLKTVTRGILKRAKKRKLIDFNVEEMFLEMDLSDSSFKKTVKDPSDEVFDDHELPILISYLTDNPDIWNLGILLILFTGLRVGELVTLSWNDIEEDRIYVHRTETAYYVDGKKEYRVKEFPKTAAGVRTVILPQDYVWILGELRRINTFGEYVFMRNGIRMNTNTIRNRIYRVCEKLGFSRKSPHKGRKTYASILLDHGIDNSLITSQMGHTDISCTETYYHKDRKSFDVKAAIINDIDEFRAAK